MARFRRFSRFDRGRSSQPRIGQLNRTTLIEPGDPFDSVSLPVSYSAGKLSSCCEEGYVL